MIIDDSAAVCAAITSGAPSCLVCQPVISEFTTPGVWPARSTSCAVWAGSNGVSKAPWRLTVTLTAAAAGASSTAIRPAARAAANQGPVPAISAQAATPTAARPIAMTAGTSQPGTWAPVVDTSQTAYAAVPTTMSSRPMIRPMGVRSGDQAATTPAPMRAATGGDSAAV